MLATETIFRTRIMQFHSKVLTLGDCFRMFDVFTKVVSQADARGEYLSDDSINALSKMVAEGNKRIDVVNRITSNSSSIVSGAARALFADQPQLIAPGGNAYTSRRMAACLDRKSVV